MLNSIENKGESEALKMPSELESKVRKVQLQRILGKQNYQYDAMEHFEPRRNSEKE